MCGNGKKKIKIWAYGIALLKLEDKDWAIRLGIGWREPLQGDPTYFWGS